MARCDTAGLIGVLRKTLEDVQDSAQADSPVIQELKRCILRSIVELQAVSEGAPSATPLRANGEGGSV